MDPFDDLYARVIVEYSLEVAAGHDLLIESTLVGAPLAEAIHRRALAVGAHPRILLQPEEWHEAKVECASDDVLGRADFLTRDAYARVDRRVKIGALGNTRDTSHLAPKRGALAWQGTMDGLRPLLRRDAAGEARWCVCRYPTNASAQEAAMSLHDYRALLTRALLFDEDDPVVAWRRMAMRQERAVGFLSDVEELRFIAPGTDLRVGVEGRTWVSAHGTHNLPDGEVYTGPHEGSAEGTVTFTFPAVWHGYEVTGIILRFEAGRVIEAQAATGEEFLRAALDLDEGARRLGELAIGLNRGIDRATGDTLLDEKIGGSFHLALGDSYPETGGSNESDLHWDMVCDLRDRGSIEADGREIYRDGRFLPELGLDE
jgi:aminopeptidase